MAPTGGADRIRHWLDVELNGKLDRIVGYVVSCVVIVGSAVNVVGGNGWIVDVHGSTLPKHGPDGVSRDGGLAVA